MTKDEKYQTIWHRYDADLDHQPNSTREAVDWAIAEGWLEEPPPDDAREKLASEMARALRAEIQTDAKAVGIESIMRFALVNMPCRQRFGRICTMLHTITWKEPSRNGATKSSAIWCS